MVKPGIGYVRVSTFNETTDSDLAEALKQLDVSKLDGLIIDLRNNGGGLLNQAVGMADMFLDKNEIVVSHRGRSSPERRYYAVRGNQGIEVPLIVLVNGQSASASEIVSGAIQDHDRGLIVGEISFGKGLVQTQFPLSEDTALLLTTARYYTPSGRLIQRDYKNVSLYDYHYNPQPPQQPEVKLTDSGRQVFGGGGITPDDVVAMPKPDDFQQTASIAAACFYPFPQGVGDFTRFYLGTKPRNHQGFRRGRRRPGSIPQISRQAAHQIHRAPTFRPIIAWLKWKIKREVFTSFFGLNEGYKVELQNDAQLEKAVELIPQAKALYQNARKIVAERKAGHIDSPVTASNSLLVSPFRQGTRFIRAVSAPEIRRLQPLRAPPSSLLPLRERLSQSISSTSTCRRTLDGSSGPKLASSAMDHSSSLFAASVGDRAKLPAMKWAIPAAWLLFVGSYFIIALVAPNGRALTAFGDISRPGGSVRLRRPAPQCRFHPSGAHAPSGCSSASAAPRGWSARSSGPISKSSCARTLPTLSSATSFSSCIPSR